MRLAFKILAVFPVLLAVVFTTLAYSADFDFQTNYTAMNKVFTPQEIRELFTTEDFKTIETIALGLRDISKTFPGGKIQIGDFYDMLIVDPRNLDGTKEKEMLTHIDHWLEQIPESTTARLAAAEYHIGLAYQERGSGWASGVTDARWRRFQFFLKRGWEYVLEVHARTDEDAALYNIAYQIASLGDINSDDFAFSDPDYQDPVTQRAPQDLLERIYAHGFQRFPSYLPIHTLRIYYLTLRWGGQPGELEHFAENVTDATQDSMGETMYPWLYWSVSSGVGEAAAHDFYDWDWERLQKGYDELLELHKPWPYWPQHYTIAACRFQDKEKAAELFGGHEEPTLNAVWRNEFSFRKWKEWAVDDKRYPFDAALENAVRFQSPERVLEVIKAGSDPNHIKANGYSVLHNAVQWGYGDTARALIEGGAKFEKQSFLLRKAMQQEEGKMLRTLFELGLDPNKEMPRLNTTMHLCANYGNEETLRICIENGGDINAVNYKGAPVLWGAISKANNKLIQPILDAGADPNVQIEFRPKGKESEIRTALTLARDQKNVEAIRILKVAGVTK